MKVEKSEVELGRQILRDKFAKQDATRTQTELFTTSTVNYQNNGADVHEAILAIMAVTSEPTEESELRAYIERMRSSAEGTISAWKSPALRRRIPAHPAETNGKNRKAYDALWRELAHHAQDILIHIDVLLKGNPREAVFAAMRHAMNLERSVIRLDLAFKMAEPNAALGRMRRAGTRTGGASRGAKTAGEAAKRKEYAIRRKEEFEAAGRPLSERENISQLTQNISRKFKKPIRPSTTKRYVRTPPKQ